MAQLNRTDATFLAAPPSQTTDFTIVFLTKAEMWTLAVRGVHATSQLRGHFPCRDTSLPTFVGVFMLSP